MNRNINGNINVSSISNLQSKLEPESTSPNTIILGIENISNNCWCISIFQCLRIHPGYRPWLDHYLKGKGDLDAWCLGFANYDKEAENIGITGTVSSSLNIQLLREKLSSSSYVPKIGKAIISANPNVQEDASEALFQLFRHVSPDQFFDWYHVKHLEPTGDVYPSLDPKRFSSLDSHNQFILSRRDWQVSIDIPSPDDNNNNNNNNNTNNESKSQKEETQLALPLSILLQKLWDFHPPTDNMEAAKYLNDKGQICGYRCTRERHFLIKHPDYITLHLKRFTQDPFNGNPFKNNRPISMPLTLHLPVVGQSALQGYSLISFIRHHGSLNSGHYVAYVSLVNNLQERIWHLCSDSCITVVNESDVIEASSLSYIYFYEKIPSIKECNQRRIRLATAASIATTITTKPKQVSSSSSFSSSSNEIQLVAPPLSLINFSSPLYAGNQLEENSSKKPVAITNQKLINLSYDIHELKRHYFSNTYWNTVFKRAAYHQPGKCNCWLDDS